MPNPTAYTFTPWWAYTEDIGDNNEPEPCGDTTATTTTHPTSTTVADTTTTGDPVIPTTTQPQTTTSTTAPAPTPTTGQAPEPVTVTVTVAVPTPTTAARPEPFTVAVATPLPADVDAVVLAPPVSHFVVVPVLPHTGVDTAQAGAVGGVLLAVGLICTALAARLNRKATR